MAWKYTLPAFVLPFVFITDPQGVALLLNFLPGMGWTDVVEQVLFATLGLAALASATQGYGLRPMAGWERWMMALAGLLMVFPAIVEAIAGADVPAPTWLGLGLALLLLAQQYARRGRAAPGTG
jgi:TRAP-type uncharacterized transport system fused permease subunit